FIKNEADANKALTNSIESLFVGAEDGSDSDIESIAKLDSDELDRIISSSNISTLLDELKLINNIYKIQTSEEYNRLYSVFFDNDFNNLFKNIVTYLSSVNYYLHVFLFHKLGNNIRECGDYLRSDAASSMSNVYNVVRYIHKIIKSHKYHNGNDDKCQLVIDSLRNSLEIMFFKERYSAFYMISIHNDSGHINRIKHKIKHDDQDDLTLNRVIEMDKVEYDSSSFSRGEFYAPDVQNCIQKSEIHLLYKNELPKPDTNEYFTFYTTTEQLIKLQALIQQPGIITPTGIERCMQIAYNLKFNSGCISRQVGAIVTDSGFSVKAVGWNDVPQNTIACLYRSADDIFLGIKDIAYSDFEHISYDYKYQENKVKGVIKGSTSKQEIITNSDYVNNNFAKNLKSLIQSRAKPVESDGKNCSFCFKSAHNTFEGEKNQVHTRSLHAEENAMLQISKHGGQELKNGLLYTTASPCELCAKKAFQLGITKIYFIDEYPGISKSHVLSGGSSVQNKFVEKIGMGSFSLT
ncbi:MAG: hypothetical protein ACSLE0_16585, partial [Chitinophagaceae bacterium]